MDPSIIAAGISGLSQLGGGIMSALGGSASNAQNAALNYANMDMQRDINTSNQTFQNNVNLANWDYQDKVNQQNFDFAREQTTASQAFAREQTGVSQDFAREQMDFQERLSSSAYQRAMVDMRKAGLNPILAYSQGGASTPGGAMGSPQNATAMGATAQSTSGQSVKLDAPQAKFAMANTQEELGRAVGRIASSAVDTYKTSEQADLVSKQAATQHYQTDKTKHEAMYARDNNFKLSAETDNARAQTAVIKAQEDLVKSQAGAARARASVDSETARQFQKNGLPGYGLGERVLRGMSDLPGPQWPPQ